MMFAKFIELLNTILNIVFPVLGGYPEIMHEGARYMGAKLYIFDPLINIANLNTAIASLLVVEIAIFTFANFKSIISHLPLIGGKG